MAETVSEHAPDSGLAGGMTLREAVDTLNMILSEIDAPVYVRIKPHRLAGVPSPHICYRGYSKGSQVPLELRLVAYRAFWLLYAAGYEGVLSKRRCFECWLAKLRPDECDHEVVWR